MCATFLTGQLNCLCGFYCLQDILGWGESDRGVSYTFGRDVVQEFLEKHNLSLICRAHQVNYIQTSDRSVCFVFKDLKFLIGCGRWVSVLSEETSKFARHKHIITKADIVRIY